MSPNTESGPWLARVNLVVTQAPGSTPSVIKIRAGEKFMLDGTEAFDLEMARRLGQVVLYDEAGPQPDLLQEPIRLGGPRRRRRGHS